MGHFACDQSVQELFQMFSCRGPDPFRHADLCPMDGIVNQKDFDIISLFSGN